MPAPEIGGSGNGAFPFGAFRRRIRVVAAADGVVEGGLEDDFHYFKVTVRHDGERVTAVASEALRWPWTTCPDAAVPLRELVGMPLSTRCLAAGDWTPPRLNCTHQFDLAGLAVAHAARHVAGGAARRQYDLEIPFGATHGGERTVRLWRDGALLHEWTLDGPGCVGPAPFSEVRWRGGFLKWADATFAPDESEAVIRAASAPATSAPGAAWISTRSTGPRSSPTTRRASATRCSPDPSRWRCATRARPATGTATPTTCWPTDLTDRPRS